MDPIIETLTLAIVLLIVGLGCVVIGVAGLVWLAERDSRGKARRAEKLTSNESFTLLSAQPRNGDDNATNRARHAEVHRNEAAPSRSAGRP